MTLSFTKMDALGNDYIFVNAFKEPSLVDALNPYISQLSDRHCGIGGDGVMFILPSAVADCRMKMFNSDGSEAGMCGNGIRQLAKIVWDQKIVTKNPFTVESSAGTHTITLELGADDLIHTVTATMGKLDFNPNHVPFLSPDGQTVKDIPTYNYIDNEYDLTFYVGGIGSKHAVCFMEENLEDVDFCKIGKQIAQDKNLFPDGVNVEFVNVISPIKIIMRVWERGAGHTLACGTGSAFAVGVAMLLEEVSNKDTVEVVLERGSLFICQKEGEILMKGPAEKIFEGTIELPIK